MQRENAERKIDTKHSLKGLWRIWGIVGLYPVRNYNIIQKVHLALILFCVNLITPLFSLIKLFCAPDFKTFLNNFTASISMVACTFKFLSIVIQRRQFIKIHDLLDELDGGTQNNPKHLDMLRRTIDLSIRITMGLFSVFEITITAESLAAAISRRMPFDVWIPLDLQRSWWLHGIIFIFIFVMFFLAAAEDSMNDICGPVFLSILYTHLEVVMKRIADIGWDAVKTQEENYVELVRCIKQHQIIMKIFAVFQDTISYTILIQLSVTSFDNTTAILHTMIYPPNLAEGLFLLVGILASTSQMFALCYFSNQFMTLTDRTVTSIYSSNFSDQSAKFKKVAIIFMEMTQQKRVAMAGKILPITLETFVSVMKFSYTLLTMSFQFRNV